MEIKKIELLNKEKVAKTISIGSGCVILRDGKVLLVRGIGGDSFKFPGGHIEDTETFKQSAERECEEEIGCKVEAVGEPVFFLFKPDETLNIVLIHYMGKIAYGEPKPSTEIEEIGWFDVDKLPSNVFDNVKPVLEIINKSVL